VRVSPDQIDRIREATNIVDIVSEHVRLKKRGRNFLGLCPFHNEKTASFNVLEDRGIFKCFGCGKGGDAFSFVMQMEGLTFPETLQKLAKRANIVLEGVEAEASEAARSERESLYNALREAAAFFYRALRSPVGDSAMSFLRERGFEDDIMRKFGLGYAPEGSGQLMQQLKSQGFSDDKLVAAGLIARRDNGELYERFRGRVIFPVFNATGRIAGFGGRVLPGAPNHLAKYINSPDTEVYHKSQILYGLFQAKDAIRRKGFAILVEGYADVLAVFQAGIENVVAASGTSLTTEQLQLLRRYVTNIVLLFDADTAGKNAAIRGIELAIEAAFDVSTVILPAGEDPDSFIRKNGREAFESAIEHRQSFIETKAQWFEEQGAFRDPGQMATAIRSIVETIAKVPDAIKRPLFIHRLGERFDLSEQMLTVELEKLVAGRDRQEDINKAREEIRRDEEIESHDHLIHFDEDIPVPKPESALLEAIIADPYGVAKLIDETGFDLNLMSHHVARELLGLLMQNIEGGELPDIAKLVSDYRGHPDYEKILIECGISENTFSPNWDQRPEEGETGPVTQARHAMASMERADASRLQRELWHKMRNPESQDALSVYMQESLKVAQRLESLKDYSFQ
jgi:DNA primase